MKPFSQKTCHYKLVQATESQWSKSIVTIVLGWSTIVWVADCCSVSIADAAIVTGSGGYVGGESGDGFRAVYGGGLL